MLGEISNFLDLVPFAARAAAPPLRRLAEHRQVVHYNGCAVRRMSAAQAAEQKVCLYLPPSLTEVMLVSLLPFLCEDSSQSGAGAGLWWVDRCLREASQEPRCNLLCRVMLPEGLPVERLVLYSSADEVRTAARDTGEESEYWRVPNGPFALHLHRLVNLAHVQLSPCVSSCLVELDVSKCRKWSQSAVANLLESLNAPLRAVRSTDVSLSAVALLRRFHKSLRVMHLTRRTPALPHAPRGLLTPAFDDEEFEEDPSAPSSADTSGKLPPVVLPRDPSPSPTPTATAAKKMPASAKAAAKPKKAESKSVTNPSKPQRKGKRTYKLPADVIPVLEELSIASSFFNAVPRWVGWCSRIQRITFVSCRFVKLTKLQGLTELREITLEGCENLASLEPLISLPQLEVLSVKNCNKLHPFKWLPRLTGALRSLVLSNSALHSLVDVTNLADAGVGLDHLRYLSLSAPSLTELEPFIARAARTLTELHLTNCNAVSDFDKLPPLPLLERVTINSNRHVKNFNWLSGSARLTELAATQCLWLESLEGLDGCHQLRRLEVTNAPRLRNVAFLARCAVLTYVDFSTCTALSDVTVLGHLPELRSALLRNCTRLPVEFGWIDSCPKLAELMVPDSTYVSTASEALRNAGRAGDVRLL